MKALALLLLLSACGEGMEPAPTPNCAQQVCRQAPYLGNGVAPLVPCPCTEAK